MDKFNRKAEEWLLFFEALDDVTLQTAPEGEGWSLAQLYDHVMKVARTYQIPHLKQSATDKATLKKRKNLFGYTLFNFGFLPKINIAMESFPPDLIAKFSPDLRDREELLIDFKKFIKEVNSLAPFLQKAEAGHKQYHPMFGNINTKEWFALIEIHLRHHDRQRKRILKKMDSIRS